MVPRNALSAADRAKIVDLVARQTERDVEEDGRLSTYLSLRRDNTNDRAREIDRHRHLAEMRRGFRDRGGRTLWRSFEVRPIIAAGDATAVVECCWQIWNTDLRPGGLSFVLCTGAFATYVEKVRGSWRLTPGNRPGFCRLWRVP